MSFQFDNNEMIPYGRQNITEDDIRVVTEVLKSDFITQGDAVPRFETAMANKVNAKYAFALNSATSALHVACLALGLGAGHTLWTTPNSFVASANCGLYCGANVDFVDINYNTLNIDSYELERKLILAERKGTLPKVLVVVHFAGQPCDMRKVSELAKKYRFSIIEDASHAVGSKYDGDYTGCCSYSDVVVFSFHPVKIITTGEGGMALTNNSELAHKIALLRSHGITKNEKEFWRRQSGPWYYEQQLLGFNFRMTDIQAALGMSQLERLDDFLNKRKFLYESYLTRLAKLPVSVPQQITECSSSHHLFPIRLQLGEMDKSRQEGVLDSNSC